MRLQDCATRRYQPRLPNAIYRSFSSVGHECLEDAVVLAEARTELGIAWGFGFREERPQAGYRHLFCIGGQSFEHAVDLSALTVGLPLGYLACPVEPARFARLAAANGAAISTGLYDRLDRIRRALSLEPAPVDDSPE